MGARNGLRALSRRVLSSGSPSSWLDRSFLPERLAQASAEFAESGCAVLDNVLAEGDARALRDNVRELFRVNAARVTPNSTFVVDLARQQVEGALPGDCDKGFVAAPGVVGTGAVLQPALAHHGFVDAAGIVEGIDHAGTHGRGIGVGRPGMHRNDAALGNLGIVGAPVGERGNEVGGTVAFHAASRGDEP